MTITQDTIPSISMSEKKPDLNRNHIKSYITCKGEIRRKQITSTKIRFSSLTSLAM